MFINPTETARFDRHTVLQQCYLLQGFLSSPDFSRAYNACTAQFGYGEDSLVDSLAEPATLLATLAESRENHPGVFPYEVTLPLGRWLAEYLAIPENEGSIEWEVFLEKASQMADLFFSKS